MRWDIETRPERTAEFGLLPPRSWPAGCCCMFACKGSQVTALLVDWLVVLMCLLIGWDSVMGCDWPRLAARITYWSATDFPLLKADPVEHLWLCRSLK